MRFRISGQTPDDATSASPDAYLHAATSRGGLRYVVIGDGTPVVLLHTLRTQLDIYSAVIDELARDGLALTAVDLPGHGHSSAPHVRYTAEYFADSIEALLAELHLTRATVVGESIGATIALMLAARRNPSVARVVAVNPYDYGRLGGIRRSSRLASVLFTAIHWPGVGPLVARGETRQILKEVLAGGLYDRSALDEGLTDELLRCGSLPGHPRALRSLCQEWRTFVTARDDYPKIDVPVTLVYGDHDWSRPDERQANASTIPNANAIELGHCGHFATLDQPRQVADVIRGQA